MTQTPDLKTIVPKTITSMGTFSQNLNLSRIFDLLPLFETPTLKAVSYKFDGLLREAGKPIVQSSTEFKNCITMEIEDKSFGKVRVVKINCEGIHLCGNRSMERARDISETILNTIIQTQRFMKHVVDGCIWDEHAFYPQMKAYLSDLKIENNLPDEDLKLLLRKLYREVLLSSDQGLWKGGSDEPRLSNLRSVMMNFTYPPIGPLLNKDIRKEEFIGGILEKSNNTNSDFEIYVSYDILSSSIGWSGSIPIRLTHRETRSEQLFTLQLRKGTIVHSGPSRDIMQEGVNVLYTNVLNCF